MGMLDSVTGKAIEEKIREYTEIYGQVLVGIHQDLQKQANLLEEYRADLATQRRRLQFLTMISASFLLLALTVGALWLSQ